MDLPTYKPRQPFETNYTYVEDNLRLAVALLDAHGAKSLGLIETITQLEAELEITRDQREKLRSGWIQLQNQICALIPPVDGERANDPCIQRVERLVRSVLRVIDYDNSLDRREVSPDGDAYNDIFSEIVYVGMGLKP